MFVAEWVSVLCALMTDGLTVYWILAHAGNRKVISEKSEESFDLPPVLAANHSKQFALPAEF